MPLITRLTLVFILVNWHVCCRSVWSTTDPDQETNLRIDLILTPDRSVDHSLSLWHSYRSADVDLTGSLSISCLVLLHKSWISLAGISSLQEAPWSVAMATPNSRDRVDVPMRRRNIFNCRGGSPVCCSYTSSPSSPLCQHSLAPLFSFLSLLHRRNFQGFLQVMSPALSFLLMKNDVKYGRPWGPLVKSR